MEAIDHIGQADREADIDNLFFAEMAFEIAVRHVIDWLEPR